MDAANNVCVICSHVKDWVQVPDDALTTVQKKGISNIVKISSEVRQDELHKYIQNKTSIKVHDKCRTKYINVKKLKEPESKRPRLVETLESSDNSNEAEPENTDFNFDNQCIVCAKKIYRYTDCSVLSSESAKNSAISFLTNGETLESSVRESILCTLLNEDDVSVVQAKYHRKNCSAKLLRLSSSNKREVELREKMKRSMEEIFNFIDDNEENQFTLQDFHNILNEKELFIPSNETIWSKLKNHYQEDITIILRKGNVSHCCLKKKGYDILNKSLNDSVDETIHDSLIDKVVKILLEDIKEYKTDHNIYPSTNDMFTQSENIPEKLKYFLDKLFLNSYIKKD